MTYYITTPLFYVNDLPHIGSAYPTIACDFFAGHMMQRGEDVKFLTGTDEHGQKIEKSAKAAGKSPQEHCDYIAEEFKKLWQILDINYDYFVRTSSKDHYQFVTEFFEKVKANGDIYKGEYKGLYCTHCEDFWLEKDLVEEGDEQLCPTHRKPVEEYSQENYFFALSKYQDKLEKYIEDNPDFISPDYRKNEVMGWIKDGLRDFPISRANLDWGIPIKDSEQVIYVWFDALLGYISGLGADRESYWKQDSKIVHIIGKDILRFHAVYWPAILMSAGYPLPAKVFGHGFLTKDGMKMGKTLGNIIDPVALTESYGAEAVRFYFLREMVFGRDGDYTDAGFIERLNSDLANNLGNLLNRALKLINKYCDGVVPEIKVASHDALHQSFVNHLDELNPYFALEEVFKMLDATNARINGVEPWRALKTEPDNQEALTSLVEALEACKQAAVYLAPIMPQLSKEIFINLGLYSKEQITELDRRSLLSKFFDLSQKDRVLAGTKVAEKPEPIFARLQRGDCDVASLAGSSQ
ncbi:MAG: methionine--tRNA ligase [Candidatus Melainabacteria bacterium]|nr:methionine--tRNA ligase [Candidatus Melainabacteria bacterium]